jgi:hypothetical protein
VQGGLGGVNLAIRFLLELALLAAVADYGYLLGDGWTSVVYPLVFAGLVAVVWGMMVSPKATVDAPRAVHFAVEVGLWAAGAAALAGAGHGWLAVVFFAAAVVSGTINLRATA